VLLRNFVKHCSQVSFAGVVVVDVPAVSGPVVDSDALCGLPLPSVVKKWKQKRICR
jgi:hypothetical protein